MTSHTPAPSNPPPTTAPVEVTETQAFTQAWILFAVLFVVVIGILW
eukprot:gene57643-78979_t